VKNARPVKVVGKEVSFEIGAHCVATLRLKFTG
jgi:hypothetical protein